MSLTLQDVTSYFDTDLPLETEMYNFRIMAAKLILSHPEMYGYKVPIDVRYPPLAHDTVELHLKTGTPILAIARAAGVTFKTIREINPELLQYDLPAGNYRLKVPAGTGKKVKRRLSLNCTSRVHDYIRHLPIQKGMPFSSPFQRGTDC